MQICDFGISKVIDGTEFMTNSGTIDGMAPEILLSKPANIKSDVFGYAMLIKEIVTRQRPYLSSNFAGIIAMIMSEKRPVIPKWVPEKWDILITQCWEQSPHARPSFTQILSTLSSFRDFGITDHELRDHHAAFKQEVCASKM